MARSILNLGLGLIAASGCAGADVAAAQAKDMRGFTFVQAEYMPMGGLRAASEFVAEALPAGLPMPEAIARAKRAGAACKAGPGGVECDYMAVVRPEGGDLGEDWWRLQLAPGPDGLLQAASVRRYRVGMVGW